MSKLRPKQAKFVKAKLDGKPNALAYTEAGYKALNRNSAEASSSRLLRNANVQQAIEEALKLAEATPEFAVKRLKAIAEQSEELGASRLASKDILELHGWQRGNRPESRLTIENAFFGNSRDIPTVDQQP